MEDQEAIKDYIKAICQVASHSRTLQGFLHEVLPIISRALCVDAISIFLANHAESALFLAATTGLEGNPRKNEVIYQIGEGFTGLVASTKAPVIIDSDEMFAHSQPLDRFLEKTLSTPKAFIAVPMLWFENKVIGAIRCVSPTPITKPEGQRLTTELQCIASLLAPYVVAVGAEDGRTTTIENITHEIKSSLVAIKNAAQMISKEEARLSGATRHRVRDITNICEMLMTIIESKTLAIDKEMTIHPKACRFYTDILMTVVGMLGSSFKRRQLELIIGPDVHRNQKVICNPQLLRLVVFNLLDNAIKYSAANTDVIVDSRSRDTNYEVTFSNQGIGIAEGEEERIFSMGFRSNAAIGRNVVGQGIGLYTCRLILERHGGTIKVSNRKNPTSFTMVIPLRKGDDSSHDPVH